MVKTKIKKFVPVQASILTSTQFYNDEFTDEVAFKSDIFRNIKVVQKTKNLLVIELEVEYTDIWDIYTEGGGGGNDFKRFIKKIVLKRLKKENISVKSVTLITNDYYGPEYTLKVKLKEPYVWQ